MTDSNNQGNNKRPELKGNNNLKYGIIVAILIGLGIGLFFMFDSDNKESGKDEEKVDTSSEVSTDVSDILAIDEEVYESIAIGTEFEDVKEALGDSFDEENVFYDNEDNPVSLRVNAHTEDGFNVEHSLIFTDGKVDAKDKFILVNDNSSREGLLEAFVADLVEKHGDYSNYNESLIEIPVETVTEEVVEETEESEEGSEGVESTDEVVEEDETVVDEDSEDPFDDVEKISTYIKSYSWYKEDEIITFRMDPAEDITAFIETIRANTFVE